MLVKIISIVRYNSEQTVIVDVDVSFLWQAEKED